jgi:hypothetical protein
MSALLCTVALLVLVLVPGVAFAADPLVNVNMDVNGGTVTVTTSGIDSSTWHPGVTGETNTFSGAGGFTGTYKSYGGNYGALASYINANSKAGGATFVFTDTQNFDVLSANWNTHVVGNSASVATGGDSNVAMNLKSIGSMYVWSEATNEYWKPGLQGNYIEKDAWVTTSGNPTAGIFMNTLTTGLATIQNSNIWGWGIDAHGLATSNYGGGTRTMTATGDGTYNQSAFGQSLLNFNGGSSGGGNATFIWNFTGGLTEPYNMDAK